MALVNWVEVPVKNYIIVTWPNIAQGATFQPYIPTFSADKSVQVEGVFGVGGTITIQGSNYQTSPIWETLKDPTGTALIISASGLYQILQASYQIMPSLSGGDVNTNLTVTMLMHRYVTGSF